MRHCTYTLLAALILTSPTLAALKSIRIDNGSIRDGTANLAGRSASLQLVVTGEGNDGQRQDVTHDVTYSAAPSGIVAIDETGWIIPLQEGHATITARTKSGQQAKAEVEVTNLINDKAINFSNQVTPIFTKQGCNSGGCHGKSGGQNGFQLSLLGFEPQEDFESLVKEARGRRLFPAVPERSLLLLKAIGEMPHGGGKRLDPTSPHYKILLRWIQQGAPFGQATDPTLTKIEVFPKERLMQLESKQQLSVVAHFSDGSVEDVTRMAQFESNDKDLAEVAETGLVSTKKSPGTIGVMIRYQSQVDVFRGIIPLGVEVTDLPPVTNLIDEHVFRQLKTLGLPPSKLADDATLLRRVTIDIAGRLPTQEEAEAYLKSTDPKKYDKLVDGLLASEDYAYYFANKWSSILRNRRLNSREDGKPTFAFHGWIKDNLHKNKPYDQFVREILTATGKEVQDPTVAWYRQVKDQALQVEDTAQLFLGQRIQCARCHHHPFEKWSQDDYYGLAAFFAQVEYQKPPKGKAKTKDKPLVEISHKKGEAKAKNPKTGNSVSPTGLGGKPMEIKPEDDPRQRLVDWMAEKDNPFFAPALVNRYWKHFFSRGLVDPEDDMRVTNPPSNPELLDAVAQHFIKNEYDLKQLIRTIVTSTTYRLSSIPNEHNADDKQNYSRFIPKRLNAEVLLDAIDTVTASPTAFNGAPKNATAVRLPDNQFDSYFLNVFGRPEGTSACECERSGEPSLAQCLHMMNSKEILSKLGGKRATDLSKDKKQSPEEKVRDLYLIALGREPDKDEMEALVAHIEKKGNDSKVAFEDIIWALISTKEFLFNH